jgi:hypothetical protein
MGNILGTSHPADGIDSRQEIQEETISDISAKDGSSEHPIIPWRTQAKMCDSPIPTFSDIPYYAKDAGLRTFVSPNIPDVTFSMSKRSELLISE